MVSVLNSIWTSLMTENEVIVNILSYVFIPIEVFINILIFTSILKINYTKCKNIFYLIVASLLAIISSVFFSVPYNTFFNVIFGIVIIYYVYNPGILKSILAFFIPSFLIVLIETLIIKIFYNIFKIPFDIIHYIPIYRIAFVVFIYLLLFLTYYLFKVLKVNIKSLELLDKKSKIVLSINLIVGLITFCVQFYLSSFYNENLPLIITLFSLLTLVTFFSISMISLLNLVRLRIVNQNLEESKLYNKTLQLLHDNVRAFRHDFSNIVAGIGGYVQTNDMEGLKKYYAQLLIDCQCTNNLTTLSPVLINNPAIYNVLANKYHKADEKGIKIELSIFYDFNKLNIKIYELTRILGILLDNAIEASCECEKKSINLVIRDEEKNKRQVVLIENTYIDKNIDTDKIFEKGFSTKEGNTGLGLWQIRQILKKNNNLNLYTSKNNMYFSQSLEIYTN